MTKLDLATKAELPPLPASWVALKEHYRNLHFDTPPAEAVEIYAVREHQLDRRLPHIEEFWRFHIAPGTMRPVDTGLRPAIRQVTSRMAERSYEVWCNITDALDELRVIEGTELKPPRYRACLNVLRCTGDALLLFDELVDVIGVHTRKEPDDVKTRASLATILDAPIINFSDWTRGWPEWRKERDGAIAYRNMLVHHGRPWLHFVSGKPFDGVPYVLRAQHCRYDGSKTENKRDFQTWSKQIEMFANPREREKFIELPDACRDTCDLTIKWLDKAYRLIVKKLDEILTKSPEKFMKYRKQWGAAD